MGLSIVAAKVGFARQAGVCVFVCQCRVQILSDEGCWASGHEGTEPCLDTGQLQSQSDPVATTGRASVLLCVQLFVIVSTKNSASCPGNSFLGCALALCCAGGV